MPRKLFRLLFLLLVLLVSLAPAGCGSSEEGVGPDGKPVPKALRPIDPVKSAPNTVEALARVQADEARYRAWAEKADQDGYARAGALFRAAARSEEIQVRNIRNVVVKLQQQELPVSAADKPLVGTTEENLKAAFEQTSLEHRTLFMGWLVSARKERSQEAVKAFDHAKGAATSLSKLFFQARSNLDSYKEPGDGFAVCMVCGNVEPVAPSTECPTCKGPQTGYQIIR